MPGLKRIATTREQWRTGCAALYRAGEALIEAGLAAVGTVDEWEDDISARQRGFLHAAVLPQIAEQARVGEKGERFVAKIWKEFYRQKFLGSRWEMVKLPGQKRATPRKVRISTEDMGVKAYSEFIDKVIADAATELGVVFVFRGEEREAVRYRAPQRKASREAVPA